MADMPRGFDAKGIRAIKRDHQQLRDMKRGGGEGPTTQINTDWGRVVETGVTTTNDDWPDYPGSDGNTFVVALERWTFTEEPGAQDVAYAESTKYVIARTEDGTYLPEGTHVTLYKQQGRGGRRWWIRKEQLPIVIKTRTAGIPARTTAYGSAVCDLLETSEDNAPVATGREITVYNIVKGTNGAVAPCTVCLAVWHRRRDGTLIPIVVVEPCEPGTLTSGGACDSDDVETPDELEDGFSRWQWDGERWNLVDAGTCSASALCSPPDAGSVDEFQDVLCTTDACRWRGDGAGGWTVASAGLCGDCGSGPTYPSVNSSHIVQLPCAI